jgi:hypothetical protein
MVNAGLVPYCKGGNLSAGTTRNEKHRFSPVESVNHEYPGGLTIDPVDDWGRE